MAAPRRLTRDRLLDVASELFAEKGYEGTSISDITDALKITRPTLYAHAKSKADLLNEINERLLAFYKKTAATYVREQDPPIKKIEGFIMMCLEATRYFPASLKLAMRGVRDASFPHSQALHEWWHSLDVVMLEAIEQAQRDQQITNTISGKILKHLIWGAINEIPYWYHPFGPLSAEQLTGQILNFVTGAVPPSDDPNNVVRHFVSPAAVTEIAREWRFETVSIGEETAVSRAVIPDDSILHGNHQMVAAVSGLVVWTCESLFRESLAPRDGEWSLEDLSLRFYPPLSAGNLYCRAIRSISSQKLDIWDVTISLDDNAEPLCVTRVVYGQKTEASPTIPR